MSNVDAVSSLPATLDPARSALAPNVNNQSFSKPRSGERPSRAPEDDVSTKADPVGDRDAPGSPKADSEAETIIQSGRESLSPEKRRKYITHDSKQRCDGNDKLDAVDRDLSNDSQSREPMVMDDSVVDGRDRDARPSSPSQRAESPSVIKTENSEESHPLRNEHDSDRATDSMPNSEGSRTSRKRSFSESVEGDSEENPVRQRQQQPPPSFRSKGRNNINGVALPRSASHARSVSPVRRSHNRTTSGPPLGGDFYKTRKAPAPIDTGFQRHSSEDRQSVSSSTSGSPLPSDHLRRLTSVDGTSASPARPMGHKKQRDQNGRTRLARACAAQEYEVAVARLAERPEDLNVADNAGNTPLQIASLEGCAPIVKILLDAGCDIETKNIDKDTPLIDAVENGHLDVVNLLLEAGANPRTVNAEGDEPYELVPSDTEEYEGIRRALAESKTASRHRRGEDHPGTINKDQSSRRASANSPRESLSIGPRSPPLFAAGSKRKSVRSEATRNDLLWTKATPENLQQFAAKGDIAGVANILNVGQKADAESLIAATKGGHDEVLSLLLGMGDADPDPDPLEGGFQKPGYNTPMLAAIGRGNLAVIRLLLDQPGFNPTRRLYRDQTYFELSRERKAENWEEESELLKDAYDNYYKARKHRKPDLSSPRRPREPEKENKRARRRESFPSVGHPRKTLGSPNRGYPPEPSSKDFSFPKERKREALQHKDRTVSARPKSHHKEDSDAGASDPDASRPDHPKPKFPPSARRGDDQNPVPRVDDHSKRRRLIPGRPPPEHGRKAHNAIPSDSPPGRDEGPKPRAGSPGTVSAKNAVAPLKRIRSSPSPEGRRSSGQDCEPHSPELQKKRRRVLSEGGASNVTNRDLKKSPVNDNKSVRQRDDEGPGGATLGIGPSREDASHKPDRNSIKEEREKHESNDLGDIPMESAENAARAAEFEAEERRRAEARKAEEERVAEEKRLAAEAEQARIAEQEAARAARLARERAEEDERKRKEAEQKRIKQAEDERQKRLEQERLRLQKLRREQEEQERRRRNALPNRLREAANLIGSNDSRARSRVWLKKFMPVVMTDTKHLDPFCEADLADEKWVPNFLVAPLLATNDLQLSQCK